MRPLQGPNGEIQYLIVSGQDVTDQREMEQALLSSEARYREMVENSLGFVFTCSMEGRLTSLNAFTAETLGYRAEALVGRIVTELMDAAGAATFQECLHTLESAGRVAGRVAAAAQRRRLPAHCVAQPAHATARRTAVCAEPRHGRDRAARGRGGAAPGHAAARTDSASRWATASTASTSTAS